MGQTLQVKTSDLLSEYLLLSKDNTTANQLIGKRRMQHHYTFLSSEANNYAVEKTRYAITKNGQRSYLLPPDYLKMKSIRIKNGDIWHPTEEVVSIDKWHQLISYPHTTNVPTYWIIFNDDGNIHVEFDGVPNVDGDSEDPNIEFIFEGYLDPLEFPTDYITGTVSVASGAATVTGADTVWTSAMVGRFLNIGKWWYEIGGVQGNGALTLVNYFQENTVAGASYTIAELLRLPAEFNYTPLWGALADYYRNSDKELSTKYEGFYARELMMLQSKYQSKSKGAVMVGRPVGGMHFNVPRNYPSGNIG